MAETLAECEQCGCGYIVEESDACDPERYCNSGCEKDHEREVELELEAD